MLRCAPVLISVLTLARSDERETLSKAPVSGCFGSASGKMKGGLGKAAHLTRGGGGCAALCPCAHPRFLGGLYALDEDTR